MSKQINKILGLSLLLIISLISFIISSNPAFAQTDGVRYRTHVQNVGWMDFVEDGNESGTTGQSLRVEALNVELKNAKDLGISYSAHVEDIGWMDPVTDGAIAGTEGQSKRVEALRISLTGADAVNYNVYYRVHSQNYGWLGWAKNGENAGTAQKALRIEALQIKVLPVTEVAPEETSEYPSYVEGDADQVQSATTMDSSNSGNVNYRVYSNSNGWTGYAHDEGQMGVTDRIEALEVNVNPSLEQKGNIIYRSLSENNGWGNWTNANGTSGYAGLGIQAVRMKLTGQLNYLYDVYYRVHMLGVGWSNWGKNGQSCGSEGYGRNISHIQVVLTNKGDRPSDGAIGNAFTQVNWAWPVPGNTSVSSYFGPRNSVHHDGIDIPAASGTPIVSAKSGVVKLSGPNGNFGNCVAIEQDSGENVYYAHMIRTAVSVGQKVAQGQVIGYVGTTGNSTGNHLHLEIYDDSDEMVNPLNFYR